MTRTLYVDGGVVDKNPSNVAGTWAYILVDGCFPGEEAKILSFGSGLISLEASKMPEITNNYTEMYAMIMGLQRTPDHENLLVCSDSQITLGRVFLNWKMKGIPSSMERSLLFIQGSIRFKMMSWLQLDGHPTKLQLENGVGEHGNPVSVWNKWCDDKCTEAAKEFKKGRTK